MVEMGEWPVVVGVSTVVSPFWLVLLTKLDIFFDDTVWASFSVVEMSEGSVVV